LGLGALEPKSRLRGHSGTLARASALGGRPSERQSLGRAPAIAAGRAPLRLAARTHDLMTTDRAYSVGHPLGVLRGASHPTHHRSQPSRHARSLNTGPRRATSRLDSVLGPDARISAISASGSLSLTGTPCSARLRSTHATALSPQTRSSSAVTTPPPAPPGREATGREHVHLRPSGAAAPYEDDAPCSPAPL
jgi:hypothetical protein